MFGFPVLMASAWYKSLVTPSAAIIFKNMVLRFFQVSIFFNGACSFTMLRKSFFPKVIDIVHDLNGVSVSRYHNKSESRYNFLKDLV